MDISGASAIVTGGASGIGAAAARALAARGAIVVVADINTELGEALAAEIKGVFARVDVTDTEQIAAAVEAAAEIAPLRACVNSAGIGWAQRTIGRDGELASAHDLGAFRKVVEINLIGTFDMTRRAATVMSRNEPDADGQRGAIVNLGVRRGVRRPDRPVVLLRLQGRRGRHDAADRPRPVGRRHPPQHGGARPDRHPRSTTRSPTRMSSRPTSARTCCSPSASATPRSWRAWSSSASPTPT
ncbi:SDR family NAD(P)-dependent oxidoreductase [Nocardioides sp. B-3]|uniref:SDR family NAD(P)-dependent oxidoreductase n=1 Tax=Nocardioides sp. B-3 TaxID=2895565 RepID=UPI003FA5C0C9